MVNHKPLDFKDHTVEVMKTDTIEVYRLTVNKSSFEAFNVILDKRTAKLFVSGDYGDAIYSFGMRSNVTFNQIARICDVSYFAGKCIASQNGRGYPDFDMDKIINKLKERYITLKKEDFNEEELNYPTWNEILTKLDIRTITSELEWNDYVYTHHCLLTTYMNLSILGFMNYNPKSNKDNCICDNFYEYLAWGTIINDYCYHHLDAIHEIDRQLTVIKEKDDQFLLTASKNTNKKRK